MHANCSKGVYIARIFLWHLSTCGSEPDNLMGLSTLHISPKVPVDNFTAGTIFKRFHGHFIIQEISGEGGKELYELKNKNIPRYLKSISSFSNPSKPALSPQMP